METVVRPAADLGSRGDSWRNNQCGPAMIRDDETVVGPRWNYVRGATCGGDEVVSPPTRLRCHVAEEVGLIEGL